MDQAASRPSSTAPNLVAIPGFLIDFLLVVIVDMVCFLSGQECKQWLIFTKGVQLLQSHSHYAPSSVGQRRLYCLRRFYELRIPLVGEMALREDEDQHRSGEWEEES
jgi:hypothetical protein